MSDPNSPIKIKVFAVTTGRPGPLPQMAESAQIELIRAARTHLPAAAKVQFIRHGGDPVSAQSAHTLNQLLGVDPAAIDEDEFLNGGSMFMRVHTAVSDAYERCCEDGLDNSMVVLVVPPDHLSDTVDYIRGARKQQTLDGTLGHAEVVRFDFTVKPGNDHILDGVEPLSHALLAA
jgi:hypothetical protein